MGQWLTTDAHHCDCALFQTPALALQASWARRAEWGDTELAVAARFHKLAVCPVP